MTLIQIAKLLAKYALLYLALALALLVFVPVVAGLAWAARLLLPVMLVALLGALGASPTARGWLRAQVGGKASW
jgi:hypothetical protein